MPCSSATAPTGERTSLRPRPAGASGRVTTATTSCRSEAINASRVGTAAAGVPAKTRRNLPTPEQRMRIFLDHRHVAVEPLRAADLPQRLLAGLLVQPIDEQHTVQVVGFVLDAPGEQVRSLDLHRLAVHVPAPGDHVPVPAAVPAHARDGEAPLRAVLLLITDNAERRASHVPGRTIHVRRAAP